jgi:hypothetical protein
MLNVSVIRTSVKTGGTHTIILQMGGWADLSGSFEILVLDSLQYLQVPDYAEKPPGGCNHGTQLPANHHVYLM